MEPLDYRQAGVDIDAGNEAVRRIRTMVAGATAYPGVIGGIGAFAGGFRLTNGTELLASTDGVGTKLCIAQAMGVYHTIGIDLVAMNVNDTLANGGAPLFFLDYVALGRLLPDRVQALVAGVITGCEQAGCALLGGETAEMPGLYGPDEFDLAGFVVAEKAFAITPAAVGDVLIGIGSSGFHSNGYSLVRAIVARHRLDLNQPYPALADGQSLGEALLTPTIIYVKPLLQWARTHPVHGMAHITGGGIVENLPRGLPPGLGARLRRGSWPMPPLLEWFRDLEAVSDAEFWRTFNGGIGFVLVVPPDLAETALAWLQEQGLAAWDIGIVTDQAGVEIR